MKRTILSYASLLLLGVSIANADQIVQLDFSNLQIGEEVLGYYSGGFGSLGTGPGPNLGLGITFTSDFVTGPLGVFPDLAQQSEQLTSASGTMDVAAGFSGPFSFYYINMSDAPSSVLLYSGLDGTGSQLGALALPAVGSFFAQGLDLMVPFESAVFNGTPNALVFGNITFGAQVIPEPSSISLLWIVLTAIFIARRSVLRRC